MRGFLTLLLSLVIASLTTVTVHGSYLDANGCAAQGAFLNNTSGRCQCQQGFKGQGDLCCSNDPDTDLCYVFGDPSLRSIAGVLVPLNLPCAVCLAIVSARTQDGRDCKWEVLGSSTIGPQGVIYNSIVKIGVSINRAQPEYIEFDGKSVSTLRRNGARANVTFGPDGTATTSIDSETVTLSSEQAGGLLGLNMCGQKLVFRPPGTGTKHTPGLCIKSPKGSITDPFSRGNICAIDATSTTSPVVTAVMDNALNTRMSFDNEQKRSHPDYDQVCRQSIDVPMSTVCLGISQEAVVQCGPILNSPSVRSCLMAAGLTGFGITELFGTCLNVYCGGERESCAQFKQSVPMQTCAPSLLNCETWPFYL